MPFVEPPAEKGCLWIADLTLEQKYAALHEIHKLAGKHPDDNNPKTYDIRADHRFDESTCVYWSATSYALQRYGPKRFSESPLYKLAHWSTEPLRVVDFSSIS